MITSINEESPPAVPRPPLSVCVPGQLFKFGIGSGEPLFMVIDPVAEQLIQSEGDVFYIGFATGRVFVASSSCAVVRYKGTATIERET